MPLNECRLIEEIANEGSLNDDESKRDDQSLPR